jgi:hypothetical protein
VVPQNHQPSTIAAPPSLTCPCAPTPYLTSSIPIGGYKDSGMGREKGEDALQHYTQVKAVVQPLRGAAWC